MAYRLGLDGKLYYAVGGQGGAFLELVNCRDVTLSLEKATADLTTRGGNGWRQEVGTLKEMTIEFQMVWDTADAGFTAIRNAFLNNSLLGLKALDGPGGQGPQGDFNIISFSRNEALEEGMTVDVTAKVAYSAVAPSWVGA